MKSKDDELRRAGEFIESSWPAMVRIARAELKDKSCAAPEAHAEDVAGSVRITLLKKWDELTSPAGAMYVITSRRARTHARKCRREYVDELDDNSVPFFSQPGQNPEEILANLEFVEWALSLLNGQEKEIIIMRFFDGLAFDSIAEMLGKPIGTVTSACSRALAKIRRAEVERDMTPRSTDKRLSI